MEKIGIITWSKQNQKLLFDITSYNGINRNLMEK